MRYLDCTRKERSYCIASKQMRLVRASMTIFSHTCKYICSHLSALVEVPKYALLHDKMTKSARTRNYISIL